MPTRQNTNNKSFFLKECLSDDEIMSTYSIMRQLRSIIEDSYINQIKTLFTEGYHLVGCFDLSSSCLGVVGYNIGHRLHTGKMIYIADLVVDEKRRSCNYGKVLIDWVKNEAIKHNCGTIVLDSGVQRASAHKFYFNNGFAITSFNFKL